MTQTSSVRHPDVISIKIELPADAQPEDFARVHDVAVRAVQSALDGVLPLGSQMEHAIKRAPLVYGITRYEPPLTAEQIATLKMPREQLYADWFSRLHDGQYPSGEPIVVRRAAHEADDRFLLRNLPFYGWTIVDTAHNNARVVYLRDDAIVHLCDNYEWMSRTVDQLNAANTSAPA